MINVVNWSCHGWILPKIAKELSRAPNFSLKEDPDPNGINYYINYKIFDPNRPTKRDILFFTHLDPGAEWFDIRILEGQEVIAMSEHGSEILKAYGIKSKYIESFGALKLEFKKIRIGISGRPYETKRKNEEILIKCAERLDPKFWQFKFYGPGWEPTIERMEKLGADIYKSESAKAFFNLIDCWFSTAKIEGGPMDALNAIAAGIPIISRAHGFAYSYATDEDIIYSDDDNLIEYLKHIEKTRKIKYNLKKKLTWDAFRNWHINYFKT